MCIDFLGEISSEFLRILVLINQFLQILHFGLQTSDIRCTGKLIQLLINDQRLFMLLLPLERIPKSKVSINILLAFTTSTLLYMINIILQQICRYSRRL